MPDENLLPGMAGIAALQSTPGEAYAVPRVTIDENGNAKITYIDVETGEVLPSLNGYNIITSDGVYRPDLLNSDEDGDGNIEPDEATNTVKALSGGGALGAAPGTPSNPSQSAARNYGYMSKPGVVGALGKLPGPMGLAGKAINAGWNMNNATATNTARDMLGLEKQTVGDSLRSVISDNKGQVTENAKIGDNNYSVGFEAMDSKDRTNLTPTEANTRANLLGGISEEKRAEATKEPSRFTRVTGIEPGFATRALNKVFGKETEAEKTTTPVATPADVDGDPTAEKSRMEKVTGVEKGWAARALDKVFGLDKNAPNTKEKVTAPSKTVAKPTATERALASNTLQGPVGDSTAESSRNTRITPGLGLENLASRDDVGFKEAYGPNRPNRPKDTIIGAVKDAVADTLGPGYSVVGTSGTENPGKQFGSPRHKTGLAIDVGVTDPTGKTVTRDQMNDVAANFAFANPEAGIGIGPGYMDADGTPRAHLDVTGRAKQWGAKNTVRNMQPAMNETIDAARAGFRPTPFANAPSPTPNPGPDTSGAFVSQDERAVDPVGQSLNPMASTSVLSGPNADDSIGRQTVANAVSPTAPADPSRAEIGMTPAQVANLGLTSRTAEEKTAMAKAIAGELSPSTLAGLKNNDPVARSEFANVMASMENRAATKKTPTIATVLSPSQYNSLDPDNLATTENNYSKFQPTLDQAVADYYSGAVKPTNYKITSYYNPDIANPAWGPKMADPEVVGDHVFGSLPEYSPSEAYSNSMFGDPAAPATPTTDTSPTDAGRSALGVAPGDRAGRSATSAPPGTSASVGRPGGMGNNGSTNTGSRGPNGATASSGRPGGMGNNGSTNTGGRGSSGASPSSGRPGGVGNNGSTNTGGGLGSPSGGSPSSGRPGGMGNNGSTNSGGSTRSGGGMNSEGSSAGAQGRSSGAW